MIYLDHNATTPLDPEVRAEIVACFEIFGNPSSLHAAGQQARRVLDVARAHRLGLLVCRSRAVPRAGGHGPDGGRTPFVDPHLPGVFPRRRTTAAGRRGRVPGGRDGAEDVNVAAEPGSRTVVAVCCDDDLGAEITAASLSREWVLGRGIN